MRRPGRGGRLAEAAAVCGLAGALAACASSPSPDEEGRPYALVYRGPAACEGCPEAVAALLEDPALGFDVDYVGPNERLDLDAATLRDADMYVQPGGDGSVERAVSVLGASASSAVEAYVDDGGRYLGFCMGAYLAGSDPGIGLLEPGDVGPYSQTVDSELTSADPAVVPVTWEGRESLQYAQDPSYVIPSGIAGERVLSRFSNGSVNALVRPYGDGTVGVIGTHPEADRSWYDAELWARDRDGRDHAVAVELVEALLAVD